MTTQADKSLIGLFVLCALALLLAAILLFGSGKFFVPTKECVFYFDSSVGGLNVGAPVVFRGVRVGEVTDIYIQTEPSELGFSIPVLAELDPTSIRVKDSGKRGDGFDDLATKRKEKPGTLLQDLIEQGLRAELKIQSLVTGQMQVVLDFHPNTPMRFVGDGKVSEIPTIPSAIDKLTKTIEDLPLNELATRLVSAVSGIERIVNSPQLNDVPAKIDATLADANSLLRKLDDKMEPLLQQFHQTMQSYKDLADNVDDRVDPLTQDLIDLTRGLKTNADSLGPAANTAMKTLDSTLLEAKQTLAAIEQVLGTNSPLVVEMRRSVSEIGGAARSIRSLADYLERHPEALIQGKDPNRR